MRDPTAKTIIKSFSNQWVCIHGTPLYLLSDQGSNVDGDTIRKFCDALNIEKRRSTPYHNQGNGFAERSIRSMRDMLRAVLLHQNISQTKWRELLPGLVFALNCSESKATKCSPYQVVFGRKPVLPIDLLLGSSIQNKINDIIKPRDYVDEIEITLRLVTEHLKLNKIEMMKQYNKNIRFYDHVAGDMVWLKTKYCKTGENRKLSARRNGPWVIVRKMPNGVNFEIKNEKTSDIKIVHHDRLSPVKKSKNVVISNNEHEDYTE